MAPLTLAQRVSLLNDVLDRGQIAAVLGLTLEDVADVALHGEQSTVSAQSGSGLTPTTLTLGPYTISGATAGGSSFFVDEVVDLGAHTLGIVNYEIVLTAIDYDGGTPDVFSIFFDSSIDGTHWTNDGSAAAVKQHPLLLSSPENLDPASVPATAAGTVLLSRYTRMAASWSGDQGPASSATFHVDLTY